MRRIAALALACVVVASPALAQSDDAAYCTVLSDYALRYLGNVGAEGGTRADFEVSEAVNNCRRGNTAAGIAALERKIRSKGFTPPARPSAQSDDTAYCTKLSDYALRYLGNVGAEGGSRPDFDVMEGVNNCRKGNTVAGIAALEKKIRSKGFTPPAR